MKLDSLTMRQWPSRGGPLAAGAPEPEIEPVEYPDVSINGLADRCASAALEWGGSDEKTASRADPILLLKDPEAHPLVLMMLVLDRYGDACLEWDPEVLRATLIKDNIQMSGLCLDKLRAVMVMIMSPSPWRQWEVFHWMCRAVTGRAPNFVFLESPEIGAMMVCADIMKLIDPPRKTAIEVDKFVAAALKLEGHVYAPPPLDFAQRELEDPQLSCPACGAEFRDDNDVRCLSCGSDQLHKITSPFATLKARVEQLWNQRKNMPLEQAVEGLDEGPAGNLVYELLLHWDYATRVRRQLLVQLRSLR